MIRPRDTTCPARKEIIRSGTSGSIPSQPATFLQGEWDSSEPHKLIFVGSTPTSATTSRPDEFGSCRKASVRSRPGRSFIMEAARA